MFILPHNHIHAETVTQSRSPFTDEKTGVGSATGLFGHGKSKCMSDSSSYTQGTRCKTRPTERIRDSATLGKEGVKYTHTQVTLSLMVTPCTGSQSLHFPPGLGRPGSSRIEVVKHAMVWPLEGEAGGFQASPSPARTPHLAG